MRSRTRGLILAATAAAALLAMSGVASATFHENLIRQIHQGTSVQDGDYVELQSYGPGQNLVGGKYIVTYDGGGGPLATVQLPANVTSGANQASILIANTAAQTPGADFYDPTLNIVNTGGYVCFQQTALGLALDCVGYGTLAGGATAPLSPVGTLAGPSTGLANGMSLTRSISRGCATALDPADDTNNSAADFAVSSRLPRSNSQTPTDTACVPVTPKKKCKKKKKHHSAAAAKKKKCKKKHKK
jgi:hypothetical protein